jgi:phospholipid/cholesterol/gamma-HCH transport system ATP-binding protein
MFMAATDPDSATPAEIRLEDVQMSFGKRSVLTRFSEHFPAGKISVVLGGSGAGKSTLLRLIGGLIAPEQGSIEIAGRSVVGASTRELRAIRDQVAMLFQGGALLDSLNVFDNIALPLREHTSLSTSEIEQRVHMALESVGLRDVDPLLPNELSGGMLRRTALARAIVHQPRILLCDEPFSGLDPISVRRIEELLVALNRTHGMTILIVSHHIPSTLRMADHVLLLLGERHVSGSPGDLRALADPEVEAFFEESRETEALA